MLVAALAGGRVEADVAERGQVYLCPQCERPVTLKRGQIRIAHFAHKPPTDCSWAQGETLAHLEAKKRICGAFASRGLRAEVEYVVPSLPSYRRADVMIWSPSNVRVAVELQHTSISIDEIEKRAFSYARAGVAQVWVPFLRPFIWREAEQLEAGKDGDFFIRKYPARPFERWVHEFHCPDFWFYDPSARVLWRGRFEDHYLWVNESRWYNDSGEEVHGGGHRRYSRRWKELTLWGPYALDQVRIKIARRKELGSDRYYMPPGRLARFVIDKNI